MAQTIDDKIAILVKKEIQSVVKAEFKIMTATILNAINAKQLTNAENFKDRLITVREARERIKLPPTEFKKLTDNGVIKTKLSPNGRKSVIESSLLAYING